jgi:hypothetical protein
VQVEYTDRIAGEDCPLVFGVETVGKFGLD